jgi:hypothetical protein
MKNTISTNDLQAEYDRLFSPPKDDPGLSAAELGKKYGMSTQRAYGMAKKAVRNGDMVQGWARRVVNGAIIRVAVFCPVKRGKK